MKNLSETIQLPFSIFLSATDQGNLENSSIPEAQREFAQRLGVSNIFDVVSFTVSVGSIVYDIYEAAGPRPVSPLASRRAAAQRKKLASLLEHSEFELNDELKAVLERALTDDQIWSSVSLTASHTVAGGGVAYLQLNSYLFELFTKCATEILSLFPVTNS